MKNILLILSKIFIVILLLTCNNADEYYDKLGSVILSSPANYSLVNSGVQVQFQWISIDGAKSIDLYIDNILKATYPSSQTTSDPISLPDGVHLWNIVAKNDSNNQTSQTYKFKVGGDKPVITFTTPTSNQIFDSTASVDVTGTIAYSDASDPITSVLVCVDNGSYTPITPLPTTSFTKTGILISSLAVGKHTLHVKTVTTMPGFESIADQDIQVDKSAPVIGISSPVINSYLQNSSATAISGTSSDDIQIDKVEIRYTDASSYTSPWATCTGTSNWSTNLDMSAESGVVTLEARVTDKVGKQTTLTRSCTIDPQDPNINITTPTTNGTTIFVYGLNYYVTGTLSSVITGSATHPYGITKVEYSTDGVNYYNCSGTTTWTISSINTTSLTNGSHIIYVRATDPAGRQASKTLDIIVDNTAPSSIAITSPSGGYIIDSASTPIGGTALDNIQIQKIEISKDGGTNWVLCSGTTAWSGNLDLSGMSGGVNVTAKVTDMVGKTNTTMISCIVDPTNPTVTITPLANNSDNIYVNGGNIYVARILSDAYSLSAIKGVATDNFGITKVEYNIDGGPSSLCSGTTSWKITSIDTHAYSGSHTINVVATDYAGRTGSSSVNIIVDNDKPSVLSYTIQNSKPSRTGGTLILPNNISQPEGNSTITGAVSDGGVGCDGANVTFVFSGSVNKTYNNCNVSSNIWTLNIDRGSAPFNTDTYFNSLTATVTVKDNLGNVSDPFIIYNLKIDKKKPSVSVGDTCTGGSTSDDETLAQVTVYGYIGYVGCYTCPHDSSPSGYYTYYNVTSISYPCLVYIDSYDDSGNHATAGTAP